VNVFPFPPSVTVPASGVTGSQVTYTIVSCSPPNYIEAYWTVFESWITRNPSGPPPDTAFTGNSITVVYDVAPNTGSARSGDIRLVIRFPGREIHYRFTINQTGTGQVTVTSSRER
jgi:hypothetical protein